MFNKELKITSRKNQTGYLLFGLCAPNAFIQSLLSWLFCVRYIWRITRISGQNISNVFPTINAVRAWTQTHFVAIPEKIFRKTAACRSWNTISKQRYHPIVLCQHMYKKETTINDDGAVDNFNPKKGGRGHTIIWTWKQKLPIFTSLALQSLITDNKTKVIIFREWKALKTVTATYR